VSRSGHPNRARSEPRSSPVQRALTARAKALEAEAGQVSAMLAAQPGLRATGDPAALKRLATEWRALAEELHHW
jgi:hypothetical protein